MCLLTFFKRVSCLHDGRIDKVSLAVLSVDIKIYLVQPLASGPVGCTPWKHQPFLKKEVTDIFREDTSYLFFFFLMSLPSSLRHLIYVEGGAQLNYKQLCGQSTVFGPGGIMSKVIQALCSLCWLDTHHGITTHSYLGGAALCESSGSPVQGG